MKIASVPCRCGQNCAYRECGSRHRRSGTSGSRAGQSSTSRSARRVSTSSRTPLVSARCGEHVTYARSPPGLVASMADTSSPRCNSPRSAMSAASRRQRASGRRRRLPSPEHGTSASTRSNASGRHPGAVPSATTVRAAPVPRRTSAASLARCSCASAARSRAPRSAAIPASSLALPPGPAHRSSQARSGPCASALVSASTASWLASSCTDARCSATAVRAPGSPPARYAPNGDHRAGLAPASTSSARFGKTGNGSQCYRWPVLVRSERRLGLGQPTGREVVCGRRLGFASRRHVLAFAEGIGEGRDDPSRVAVSDRQMPHWIRCPVRSDDLEPGLEVAGRHPPQHRVDESCRAPPGYRNRQVNCGRHGGMRLDPHTEQLMGPQPEHIEHWWVDIAQVPIGAHPDDRVVASQVSQRSVDQLSRQSRVLTAQTTVAQGSRQQQVRVGVTPADAGKHLVRHSPRPSRSAYPGSLPARARPALPSVACPCWFARPPSAGPASPART